MRTIQKLFKYITRYKTAVALNIFCNILMVFFNLVSIPMLIPFLQILLGQTIPPTQRVDFQWNINSIKDWVNWKLGDLIIQSGSAEQALIYVCIALATVFFFKNLFRYGALFFITPMRNGIVRDLRQALFDKTMRLPMAFFSDERKGDLISRVAADVQEVEWSVLSVLESLVREPLLVLGALGLMIYISPTLTGFVLTLLLFTGFIIGGIGKTLKRESKDLQVKLGSMVSVLDESLGSGRVIRGFNAENYLKNKFSVENNQFRQLLTRVLRRRDLASPTTEFLGVCVVCLLIWFGFKQVQTAVLTPASFLAFLYAFFTVIEPAKSFSAASFILQKGAGALERIEEILDAEESIFDQPNALPVAHFLDKIEYKNVHFEYKTGENPVLEGIDLTIKKGQIIALVGSSGAGKSTLVDLLPRFYDVTKGEILVDGQDIRALKLFDLRNLLGIVTQEAILFNDSIYNNIAFGMADATQNSIENAAKMANAHDFILQTESGYQTNIGDRGSKLSGGQRQRLTIARAILRNPEILILDEATSALDSESEKLVQAALQILMKNRTAIVIAHRLSTVQKADEIIVLEAGKIIERGTHESLLKLGGKYQKLVNLQGFQ